MSEEMDTGTGEMIERPADTRGTLARTSAVGTELARQAETASFAMAERQRATIQARHQVAKSCPRDLERVHESLMAACKRPRFAESARYRKPVGSKMVGGQWVEQFAEGPSIRFIEAATQMMGNFDVSSVTIADTETTRTIEITAVDFETNASWSNQLTIAKTTEKSKPPKGRPVIGTRVNSRGAPTYLVVATEDETAMKVAASVSKVARTLAQRLIPIDIVEDAMDQVDVTLLAEQQRDPTGVRAKMIAGFAGSGISTSDLESYLGGPPDMATPQQVTELRKLFSALRDGELTWAEMLESSPYRPRPAVAETGGAPTSITEAAKRAAAKAKGKPAEAPVAQAAQPVSDPAVTAAKAAVKPAEPGKKPTREPGDDDQ